MVSTRDVQLAKQLSHFGVPVAVEVNPDTPASVFDSFNNVVIKQSDLSAVMPKLRGQAITLLTDQCEFIDCDFASLLEDTGSKLRKRPDLVLARVVASAHQL